MVTKVNERMASLADQVREETQHIHGALRMAAASGTTAVMVAFPTVAAYAAEGEGSGTNVLQGEVWTAVVSGFSDLAVTFTALIAIGAVTGLTIACTAAGAKYAVKYIKGLLSQAG